MLGEYLGIYSAKIRVGGLPRGPQARGSALRACELLVCVFTPSSSLPGVFWSMKNHRERFAPFGLRLIFLFCKTQKQEK